jgi:acyl-CoA dehydrogenase
VTDFMAGHVYPNKRLYSEQAQAAGPFGYPAFTDELRPLARAAGLWNLFLPPGQRGRTCQAPALSEFLT